MTAQLTPIPFYRDFDNQGNPLAFGSVYTYQAGTTTLTATYIDSTQTTPNTNPVVLNARGEAQIWLVPGLTYKFAVFDQYGNQIRIVDQIYSVQGLNALTQTIIGMLLYPQTAAESGVTIVNYAYAPGNVLRYGNNTTPGTTNMSVALQAAINVVGLGGAIQVVLPPGAIYVNSTITLSSAGVWVVGGAGGSSIYVGDVGSDLFQITANSCTLSDFDITPASGVTRNGGYYINVIGDISYTRIMRVGMFNFYDAVGFTGTGGGTTIRVIDCDMQTNVSGAVGINFVNTSAPVDVVLENLFITGNYNGGSPINLAAAVQLNNVADITLKHVSTVYAGSGIRANPGSGQEVQSLFVSDSLFDSNSNSGGGSGNAVDLNPAAGGNIYLAKFTNVWACSSASGIVLGASGTGAVTNCTFVNCYGSNNTAGSGLDIASSIVTDTTITESGFSANTYGIYVASGVTKFFLRGNICRATGQFNTNNSSYGLVTGGSNASFEIVNNDLNNGGSNFSIGSITGANYTIDGNLGYLTRNSGNIGGAATGQTVNHGLGTTPTVVLLQAMDGVPTGLYPSSIGATSFTLTFGGGGTHAFSWQASALENG
jgi:hypothetical protein